MAFLQTHFFRNGTGEVNRFPRGAYSSVYKHTQTSPAIPNPNPITKKKSRLPKIFLVPMNFLSRARTLALVAPAPGPASALTLVPPLRFSGCGFSLRGFRPPSWVFLV